MFFLPSSVFCGLDVTFVKVSKVTGRVEVNDVLAAVRPNTCLISVMLANNETGVIMVRSIKILEDVKGQGRGIG